MYLYFQNVKTDLIKLVYSIGFTDSAVVDILPRSEIEVDGVLQITKHKTKSKLDQKTISRVKAVLTAGLYPNIAKVTYEAPVDAAANPEQKICMAETPQGPACVHPSSTNRTLQANGWLVFHEKVSGKYVTMTKLLIQYLQYMFGSFLIEERSTINCYLNNCNVKPDQPELGFTLYLAYIKQPPTLIGHSGSGNIGSFRGELVHLL